MRGSREFPGPDFALHSVQDEGTHVGVRADHPVTDQASFGTRYRRAAPPSSRPHTRLALSLGQTYESTSNQGERVVSGRRLMQATSDIFLGRERVDGIDGKPPAPSRRQEHKGW
nr:DUF2252 family protein [Streptomyces phaeoluteigriseus]